jgi:D-serine deaminase-like pyridoxal phosphate-dependent protein
MRRNRSDIVDPIAGLTAATADLDPPFAALDLAVLRSNAGELVARCAGKRLRVASKSVRCRNLLELTLATPGFTGVMAYSLREALWLARATSADVLLGYPTVDRAAIRELGTDDRMLGAVTLMVDDPDQLALIRSVLPGARVRICIDVDASLRIGPVHLGVHRSPLHSVADAVALARQATDEGFVVAGLMFYDAQIAGLPDRSAAVRLMKRRSDAELRRRRPAVVEAVEKQVGALEFVNSGGTGSLERSSADPAVTELTAGSGLYMPALFDQYDAFTARPALFFALPVTRRPAARIATLFGGGYPASGPAGRSRLPRPVDAGLALFKAEGTGEVQTPVRGRAASRLRIGDRVWFRHAKAGELAERFGVIHLVEDGRLVGSVPTYRGEGMFFG